ncbi:hypothetical protein ACEQ8H_008125 [Pleosporales sp. CAS-2024a]
MTDQSSLIPPPEGDFAMATPSGLTPGTRSAAEEAFALNAIAQTDSAAPDPSLTEAQLAYRRPGIPRASSYNYENALQRAKQSSISSNMSTDTVTDGTAESLPLPQPGQGVVPLSYASTPAGAPSKDAVKKTRSRGLSLGALARQQSFSEEDYKHLYSAKLAEETKLDAGYGSGAQQKVEGS